MKKAVCLFLSLFFLIGFPFSALCDESFEAEPYEKTEFPQWLRDAGRFEIISLGSVPFVMLDVSLVYGLYKYVSGKSSKFVNPFASSNSSDGFTKNEQKKILAASFGIGLGIGLTDLIVNFVKRKKAEKEAERILAGSGQVVVIPFKNPQNEDSQDASDKMTDPGKER